MSLVQPRLAQGNARINRFTPRRPSSPFDALRARDPRSDRRLVLCDGIFLMNSGRIIREDNGDALSMQVLVCQINSRD